MLFLCLDHDTRGHSATDLTDFAAAIVLHVGSYGDWWLLWSIPSALGNDQRANRVIIHPHVAAQQTLELFSRPDIQADSSLVRVLNFYGRLL